MLTLNFAKNWEANNLTPAQDRANPVLRPVKRVYKYPELEFKTQGTIVPL